MDGYAVAHVDEIAEVDDGRAPMRAVRHHFGITSFGVNAWTGHQAGAQIINEHDESEPDSQEELYLVLSGRASFEVDGDQFDAPAGRGGTSRRELLAEEPPYADLFYNVACCESLAGQTDEAIRHLRRAIALSERTRALLEGDSDLDPLREDPAFKDLLAG